VGPFASGGHGSFFFYQSGGDFFFLNVCWGTPAIRKGAQWGPRLFVFATGRPKKENWAPKKEKKETLSPRKKKGKKKRLKNGPGVGVG
jgi:hypothetical protein